MSVDDLRTAIHAIHAIFERDKQAAPPPRPRGPFAPREVQGYWLEPRDLPLQGRKGRDVVQERAEARRDPGRRDTGERKGWRENVRRWLETLNLDDTPADMKRKAQEPLPEPTSKRPPADMSQKASFAPHVFDAATVTAHKAAYAASEPYKHDVVQGLIADGLLRSVRHEIVTKISFAPKETDIYKIHQSGDLANLDGLDAASLQQLPSLVKLRDALYGAEFRGWLEEVVQGCGKLSGKRTDMAVNVYTPGCHLLCHDDVIGTRRVSYILYLTDPDEPWQETWGGALRLYPTHTVTPPKGSTKDRNGTSFKTPAPTWTKAIPPAWNQLSFFAVQPGESFHDVEEVYHGDGGRVRMAISGWFHIPQEGEDGFVPGREAQLAAQSSLAQLQGTAGDVLDAPQPLWIAHPEAIQHASDNTAEEQAEEDAALSMQDLELLVQYLNPRYLVPETVDVMAAQFKEDSCLRLGQFLAPKFAERLRAEIAAADTAPAAPSSAWAVACPPHKQRFLFRQLGMPAGALPLLDEVLTQLLPSLAFKKWLRLVTALGLDEVNVLARRFRRGLDYSLAKGYGEEMPRLEGSLGLTPSGGWGAEEEPADDDRDIAGSGKGKGAAAPSAEGPEGGVGGYELYMAGDDDDDDDDDAASDADAADAAPKKAATHTGAGQRRERLDPAVYRAAEDDDDGIMMTVPAEWNTLTLVLRDRGTMRFVKYVSRAAKGDRWDVGGEWRVGDMGESDDEGGYSGEGEDSDEDGNEDEEDGEGDEGAEGEDGWEMV